jgi:FADH2 O2-dependent halogenase
MSDLAQLAAYGKWMEHMPVVRRGLKRGFTFYRHRPGLEFADSPGNEHRLLVAASPDDAVADSHWLRQDVDHHLVRLAIAEGVDYRDQTEIRGLRQAAGEPWLLSGVAHESPFELAADFLIDGSGAGGFLANALPIESALDEVEIDTSLVYGHFGELGPFPELPPGPYPDQRAAVHHLLDEGWMYVLPFDHGVVSAGILLRREAMEELAAAGHESPEAIWRQVIGRYPTLERQFGRSVAVRPLELMPRVQRRLQSAAGEGWAVLPHTYSFLDPMYSTGIAWSLLAVERLGLIFTAGSDRGQLAPYEINAGMLRYGRQLAIEAQHMETLMAGTYLAMRDFELFVAQSFLYFATVSFEEVDQRLFPSGHAGQPPAWGGFLGAGDPHLESIFVDSKERLEAILLNREAEPEDSEREDFVTWIRAAIAGRNIAGLGDPDRRNLYPVDLDLLVERADLVGLTPQEMQTQLHRLRGMGEAP